MKKYLKVFWIPQVPMTPFNVEVSSVEEGVKIIDTLAKYDQFQFDHNIKPDYCNAGGLMVSDTGEDDDWEDWYIYTEKDEYFDDPYEYLESIKEK